MSLGLIIIVYCLIFGFLSWKKIDWAIGLVVFMLPSYLIRFRLFGIPMTLLEAMIVILFIVWITRNYAKLNLPTQMLRQAGAKLRETILDNNYKWPILLLLAAATASVFFSANKMEALGIWKAYFVEPVLFFIVLVGNYTSIRMNFNANLRIREYTNKIIVAFGASALVVAVYAVIQKFTGWGIPNEFWSAEATRRVTSFFGYPNGVGLYLAPITILFIGLLVDYAVTKISKPAYIKIPVDKHQNVNKTIGGNTATQIAVLLFCCFVILLSLAAIFFARSEGALVALSGGIVLFVLLYSLACPPKLQRRRVLLVAIVAVVIITIVVSIAPLKNYVLQKFTLSDLSGQIRQEQWKETWNMLKDGRLLTGAGLANYQAAVKPYHQEGVWIKTGEPDWLEKIRTDEKFRVAHWQPVEIYLYPHNFILNFWSETGLLGLIAMIWLVVLFILNYWQVEKGNRKYYLILICVLATILIHGTVDAPYFKNDLSVMWWLLIGGSIILTYKNELTRIHTN